MMMQPMAMISEERLEALRMGERQLMPLGGDIGRPVLAVGQKREELRDRGPFVA
jgi:hypothetical protein